MAGLSPFPGDLLRSGQYRYMESSGCGVFDNDYALEWSYELNGPSGLISLKAALGGAREGYLEVDEAALALAAGAVVAAAGGPPVEGMPVDLVAWSRSHSQLLLPLVGAALRSVRVAVRSSALVDDWERSGLDSALEEAAEVERLLVSLERRLS